MKFESLTNYDVTLEDVSGYADTIFDIINIKQIDNKIIMEVVDSGFDIPDCFVYVDNENHTNEFAVSADITEYESHFTLTIPKKLFDKAVSQGSMIIDHYSDDVDIEFGDYTLECKVDYIRDENKDEYVDVNSVDISKIKEELYDEYISGYFYNVHHNAMVKLKLFVELYN